MAVQVQHKPSHQENGFDCEDDALSTFTSGGVVQIVASADKSACIKRSDKFDHKTHILNGFNRFIALELS